MFLKKKFFFVCQITVKYTNVNIKNNEDPISTHFFKIRLKAQPGFTRVKPMGKPGERWALRTLQNGEKNHCCLDKEHKPGISEV